MNGCMMAGKTEHQDNDADLENDVKAEIDQPLGVDKRELKEMADAILKAGAEQINDGEDAAENLEDPDGPGDPDGDDDDSGEFADPLVALVNDLKEVHAQKDELQNQLLRTVAEMENLRKRTRKEVADAREFSIASFARDLLSVSDNLRRTIDAVPEGEAKADSSVLKNLLEGVSMTERELLSSLEKHKIRKLSPKGEKFDPNFHQAMFEVPDKTIPNNTVVEVIQDGYVIGERMLRPAMVGVSKGGPKKPKQDTQPSEEDQEPGLAI